MENVGKICESIINRMLTNTTTLDNGSNSPDLALGYTDVPPDTRNAENDRLAAVREKITVMLAERGVKKRYLNCSFENFQTRNEILKNVKDRLESITQEFTDSVFITSSNSGTGKTHLAVALLRKLLWNGFTSFRFASSPDIFLEIKSCYSDNTPESRIINKYCNYQLLVIDDIGVERVSEWALQIWYMIIDRRYSEMKPTVYTSNLSIREIAEKLDTRIASRLSSGIVITIESEDFRLKQRIK